MTTKAPIIATKRAAREQLRITRRRRAIELMATPIGQMIFGVSAQVPRAGISCTTDRLLGVRKVNTTLTESIKSSLRLRFRYWDNRPMRKTPGGLRESQPRGGPYSCPQ